MSEIHDAPENERKRHKELERPSSQKYSVRPAQTHLAMHSEKSSRYPETRELWDDQMAELYYSLHSMTGRKNSMVILLMGAGAGEGTTTVVDQLARVSAIGLGKSVLVLRTQHDPPANDGASSGFTVHDLERLGDGVSAEDVFLNKDDACLLEWSLNHSASAHKILASSRMTIVLTKLREHFDLILIDTAPISVSTVGLALCQRVDGVVFVIEAEKTKSSSARNLKEKIERAGGNILGVVLNKYQSHLPDRINCRF